MDSFMELSVKRGGMDFHDFEVEYRLCGSIRMDKGPMAEDMT